MDNNQTNNEGLQLLELGMQASDRELLEWLKAVLAERNRKRHPTIQIE